MRALVCEELGGEELLVVRDDWPSKPCGPSDVRIAVQAASVNFPDTLVIRGLYQVKQDPPFVVGNELAGVVTEVGADVTGFVTGDRVLAMIGAGAFVEEVVVATPPTQVHRIPAEMPFDEAAAFNLTYGTAGHAWDRADLAAGETVLVLGAAGGCGSAAVEIAKARGAVVIAVAGGPEKGALCRELGADHVIDHTTTAALAPAVRELTGDAGADVLFDPVGGADVRDNLRCLAWNGRYLVVGFTAGAIPQVGLNQTILKSISFVGIAYGASAVRDPAGNRELFDRLFDSYRRGQVRPRIGHRFPLEDGAEAVRVVRDRRALGKVVIDIGSQF
jgi:NADPH2:quinone reductase